jgi:phage tail tube protein FII
MRSVEFSVLKNASVYSENVFIGKATEIILPQPQVEMGAYRGLGFAAKIQLPTGFRPPLLIIVGLAPNEFPTPPLSGQVRGVCRCHLTDCVPEARVEDLLVKLEFAGPKRQGTNLNRTAIDIHYMKLEVADEEVELIDVIGGVWKRGDRYVQRPPGSELP